MFAFGVLRNKKITLNGAVSLQGTLLTTDDLVFLVPFTVVGDTTINATKLSISEGTVTLTPELLAFSQSIELIGGTLQFVSSKRQVLEYPGTLRWTSGTIIVAATELDVSGLSIFSQFAENFVVFALLNGWIRSCDPRIQQSR